MSYERKVSALITLISALILLTPLCGFLFQCGCDWPWLGLDAGCNFYKQHTEHKCPWCVSMLTGVLSLGAAVGLGCLLAVLPKLQGTQKNREIGLRVLMGLSAFVIVGVLTAAVAAVEQAYPLGIGRFL